MEQTENFQQLTTQLGKILEVAARWGHSSSRGGGQVLLDRGEKALQSVQNSKICLSKHHTLTEQVGRNVQVVTVQPGRVNSPAVAWVAFLLWIIKLSKIQRSSLRDILWADLFCNDYSNSTAYSLLSARHIFIWLSNLGYTKYHHRVHHSALLANCVLFHAMFYCFSTCECKTMSVLQHVRMWNHHA